MVEDIRHLVYGRVLEYVRRGSYETAQQLIVEFNVDVNDVPVGPAAVPIMHTAMLSLPHANVNKLHCFLDFLIERGADLELKSTSGWTPFTYAVSYSRYATLDTLRYLMRKGANARHCDDDGRNALHDVVSGYLNNDVDIVQERIEFLVGEVGLDPNSLTKKGVIPLQFCVLESSIVHVETLLKLGSNPNHQSKSGNTAFTNAAHYSNNKQSKVFDLLLKYGANPFHRWAKMGNALEILIQSHLAKNQPPPLNVVKTLVGMGLCVTDALVKIYLDKTSSYDNVGCYLRDFPRHHLKALLYRLREELVQLTLENDAGKRIAIAKCDLQVTDVDCMRMFQVPYHCLFESMNLFMEWARRHPTLFEINDDAAIDALRAEITSVISALARAYEHTCMGRAQLRALADEMADCSARKRERTQ